MKSLITKKRVGDARYGPLWRIYINGLATPFTVTKSVPPKFGRPQEWDVIDGPDEDLDLLFSAKSLEQAMNVIYRITQVALDQRR